MTDEKLARLNWLKGEIVEQKRILDRLAVVKYNLTPTNDPKEAKEGAIIVGHSELRVTTTNSAIHVIEVPFICLPEILDELERRYRINLDVLEMEFNQA